VHFHPRIGFTDPLVLVAGGGKWSKVEGSGRVDPAGPGIQADRETAGGRGWPMFLGTHTPRLDDKGRLILPAKFRDELAGGVVITKGQERCLYVFPMPEFQRIAGQLRETPVTNKAARAYGRVFFASAHDEVPDKQGRVTIPGHLREYAALDRELVVIGASTRVEIWDKQSWEQYLSASEDDFADIEEGVLPGGL
jgi:MraZ protein